jgi:hypothetical protein
MRTIREDPEPGFIPDFGIGNAGWNKIPAIIVFRTAFAYKRTSNIAKIGPLPDCRFCCFESDAVIERCRHHNFGDSH